MSVLAAIVDWVNPAPLLEDLSALLAVASVRVPDGKRFARVPHALLGHGARFVRRAERTILQPFRDDRRGLCITGDLRLDNRDELSGALPPGDPRLVSDVLLLAAAYERWGVGAVERLVGDFAFVIWDARKRTLLAARDPFGVRSLVYHRGRDRLLLATEPGQLLSLLEVDRSPNVQVVVDYLSRSYAHYGPTFFRSIRAIEPGHYLRANGGEIQLVDYYRPPLRVTRRASPEEYREEFRWQFTRAVDQRLDSDYPIVAHLSGGLDSSSIVCAADRIFSNGDVVRPPLHLASALFEGKRYDETMFIDEVVRSVRFPSHRWDGNRPSGREFDMPSLSAPGTSVAFNGGSTGDIEIAQELGARTILSGDPGDLITGELGLFNELIVRRRFIKLAQQVASGGSYNERRLRRTLLKRAAREEAPPAVLHLWRLLARRPARTPVPSWLNRLCDGMWTGPKPGDPPARRFGLNRVQQRLWDFWRWPRISSVTDLMGFYSAGAGLEVRFPFLDQRLVEFMFSVPPDERLLGQFRRKLHRDAMAGILPDSIARRPSKPAFNGAIVHWGHRSLPAIRGILEDQEWRSAPFVDRKKALEVLTGLASKPEDRRDWEQWVAVRSIVHLETWLRSTFRYACREESLPMSEMRSVSGREEATDLDTVRQAQPDAYVPPRLTAVGNVRDLLAAANLSGTDTLADAPSAET